MITRPLDLESRLSPPARDLDAMAWMNVGIIVLCFSLLGSRFVLAPGLLIGREADGFSLPTATDLQYSPTGSVMVNYLQDDLIIFEDAFIKLPELRKRLEAYAKQHPGEVLLLLADKRVSAQALADLTAMATSAGFANVQMGAEIPKTGNPMQQVDRDAAR